jgi:integrase
MRVNPGQRVWRSDATRSTAFTSLTRPTGTAPRASQRWTALVESPSSRARSVCVMPAGTRIDPSNYRRRLLKVAAREGNGPRTTHDLRHAAGSILFDQGSP